jgi:hypothetical protein
MAVVVVTRVEGEGEEEGRDDERLADGNRTAVV